jgi:hypothetical protein
LRVTIAGEILWRRHPIVFPDPDVGGVDRGDQIGKARRVVERPARPQRLAELGEVRVLWTDLPHPAPSACRVFASGRHLDTDPARAPATLERRQTGIMGDRSGIRTRDTDDAQILVASLITPRLRGAILGPVRGLVRSTRKGSGRFATAFCGIRKK